MGKCYEDSEAKRATIYRTTLATGGYARSLAFNPNKMEVFNEVFLEKLKKVGIVSGLPKFNIQIEDKLRV
ncbi:hypothetical protein SESBI_03614 [Sesbania bispinosa]|nr:hypothetical protein SESBI_03614 [Sesbania bispinosa]